MLETGCSMDVENSRSFLWRNSKLPFVLKIIFSLEAQNSLEPYFTWYYAVTYEWKYTLLNMFFPAAGFKCGCRDSHTCNLVVLPFNTRQSTFKIPFNTLESKSGLSLRIKEYIWYCLNFYFNLVHVKYLADNAAVHISEDILKLSGGEKYHRVAKSSVEICASWSWDWIFYVK